MSDSNNQRKVYLEDPYFSCSTMIAEYCKHLDDGAYQSAIDSIKQFQSVLGVLPFESDQKQLAACLNQHFVESPDALRSLISEQLPSLLVAIHSESNNHITA